MGGVGGGGGGGGMHVLHFLLHLNGTELGIIGSS